MKSQNAGIDSRAQSREGQSCPACGMERASWPDEGYVRAGVEFCCQGCADGSGCTCFQKNVGGAISRSSDA
jgi:hypothetical protein